MLNYFQKVIQKCGGYRNFILRSKDIAVVDKIVAARKDLKAAQEMAFREICNGMPPPNYKSKNENNQKNEMPKEIWNSKPNILNHSKSSGNILSGQPNQHSSPESFFSESRGNSVYYKVRFFRL